jgi:FKBP-type peptidyl-prolyl cis-trans isomerase
VFEEGMFYQSLKEGTGRLVKVSDTLTVHYKGSLFSDGSVFDETKDKPATFPLERLIKGWQLGLIHCKVGGNMRLYLPSGSAYGIRTRSANIPPNSILVFDVEVLDAKEKIVR